VPEVSVVWFASKVDWWLRIILFLPPMASLAVLGASLASGDRGEIVVAAIICAAVAALYGLLVIPIRYGLGSDELTVRFGVFRQRIPLAAIQEVAPSRNLLSSPALSLDRLAIRTGPGLLATTMISPLDREVFLTMLAARAGLKLDGGRLVRG